MHTRKEHDSLGTKDIPAMVLWGIQTKRAIDNYRLSSEKVNQKIIFSIAAIKIAAARANRAADGLSAKHAQAIGRAAKEILDRKHDDQFPLDAIQAGAGTSTHMNVNEVVANRANEMLGSKRGVYKPIHPNDHVNMGQSTNDVYPTAMRISAVSLVLSELFPALRTFESSLAKKTYEFMRIKKAGRTHLQDAVPIRLGNEFHAYETIVRKARGRITRCLEDLLEIGLGGTAVGSGLNAHPVYKKQVVYELAKITKLALRPAEDTFSATSSMAPFTSLSGELRNLAIELNKIGSDIRLLASGPTTGLGEIHLPAVQPGSSIMPGKINPSIVEATHMACYHVIGKDAAIAGAAQAGQLELNVMMPLIAHEILSSIHILAQAVQMFDGLCVRGIMADKKRCEHYLHSTVGLATILNPVIGYEKAAEIAKETVKKRKTIREVVVEKGVLSAKEFDVLLEKSIR